MADETLYLVLRSGDGDVWHQVGLIRANSGEHAVSKSGGAIGDYITVEAKEVHSFEIQPQIVSRGRLEGAVASG